MKMANVRDSDTSLWLHNKLGTSNDSWTSGSICSQLNKEVLRNIKDCFPDLQTQVKLKLLLSFFHIPRRLVEEWKSELEDIIELASSDTELWVSMIAETIKTFPKTGSLNTEISDYEETRPIFTDMVNDLRRLINKHSDIPMLPLECQYLNKAALISVVGQQSAPVKHFTIKKKPKSAALKAELLQKCADAQSVKKTSAPTIPLRSRGMPRKMTDTTPLKGIPSRVPSGGGFRTPTSGTPGQSRPNLSRTPAGRKDGGIKLLDITEQPLGYAALKKRKRQQDLEDQQKRALEAQSNIPVKTEPGSTSPVPTTPDYAAGLNATSIYTQPPTPTVVPLKDNQLLTIDTPVIIAGLNSPMASPTQNACKSEENETPRTPPAVIKFIKSEPNPSPTKNEVTITIKSEKIHIKSEPTASAPPTSVTVLQSPPPAATIVSMPPLTPTTTKPKQVLITKNAPNVISTITNNNSSSIIYVKSEPNVVTKATTPAKTTAASTKKAATAKAKNQQKQQAAAAAASAAAAAAITAAAQPLPAVVAPNVVPVTKQPTLLQVPTTLTSQQYVTPKLASITKQPAAKKQKINIQSMISSLSGNVPMPSLTALSANNTKIQKQVQTPPKLQHLQIPTQIGSTKIVQIKAPSTIQMVGQNQRATQQNPPPLIPTQQPTILNIRNVSIAGRTQQQISSAQQPASSTSSSQQQAHTTNASNISYITTTTSQQPQQQQQHIQQLQVQKQQQQPQLINQQGQQIHIQQSSQPNTIQMQSANSSAKYNQVLMSNAGSTIILSSSNKSVQQQQQQQHQQQQPALQQKSIILRTVGPDGKAVFQQVPLSSIAGLNISGTVGGGGGVIGNTGNNVTLISSPQSAGLVKNQQPQQIQIQQQMPSLVPTSNYAQSLQNMPVVISTNNATHQTLPQLITSIQNQQQQQQQQTIHIQQQPQQQQQQQITTTLPGNTIIRPVMVTNQQGVQMLPQGLTLIQRPGQQPQLVQTIQQQQPQQQQQQQLHRTIITQQKAQPQQVGQLQIRQQQQQPQQIIIQQQQQLPPNVISIQKTVQPQQQQQQQQQAQQVVVQQQATQSPAPQRKSIKLSSEYMMKAQEMFRRANGVTRRDKALILSFMAGCRENPQPSPDNSIIIKLGDAEERVKNQDNTVGLMHVESFIKLDYNTGKWEKFQNYRRPDTKAAAQSQQQQQQQIQQQ